VASLFIGSSQGTTAFDEIGAQVIVVLLLALALEARFFRLHRVREPLELGATLFTMLVLGAGEFYASIGPSRTGSVTVRNAWGRVGPAGSDEESNSDQLRDYEDPAGAKHGSESRAIPRSQ
jgi:hypothetical protein